MGPKQISRDVLVQYLAQALNIAQYKDYCPNGLQVEGRATISRIVSGVTASAALIEAAIAEKADAILVHHGYFWRGEDPCITGMKGRRIRRLLENNINLLAYHLPLDGHPQWGNNAQLGKVLGLAGEAAFAEGRLAWLGKDAEGTAGTLADLAGRIEARLQRKPLVIGDMAMPVNMIGWCTGGAQGMIEDAAAAGASVYISGEISEQTVHAARELGIAYVSAGHHATERYGVQAVGAHLAQQFGIAHLFVEVPNPV